ncbi:hypothetical protein HYX00_06335 [Candidatus Woesearchaeota archaeon]|nr:hypothetical protein [Candidatus Woesearchaeota archaeon]
MVLLQIDLSEEENKTVEVYKALKGFITKEEAVKNIIKEFKPKLKI